MATELTEDMKALLEYALVYLIENEESAGYTIDEWDDETIKATKTWTQEPLYPPTDVSKKLCPYCNRFTTVWRFPHDSGTVNIRRCENCYEHFVYFTLHPRHGTKIVTEQEFHAMMNDPRPWPGERAPMPDSPQALNY